MSTFNNNPYIIESDDIEELLSISVDEGDQGSAEITLVVRLRPDAKVALDGARPLGLSLDGILPKLLYVAPVVVPAEESEPVEEQPAAPAPPKKQPKKQPAVQAPEEIKAFGITDEGTSHES